MTFLKDKFSAIQPFFKTLLSDGINITALFKGDFINVFRGTSKVLVDLGSKAFNMVKSMKLMRGGFLGLVESGTGVGLALTFLGSQMKKSESAFVRFIGTITQMIGLLSISFSTAATIAIAAIGQLTTAVGSKLIKVMEKWEEKFVKVQQITRAFEFTIRGFGKAVGTTAIGSIGFWNEQIDNMTKTTSFGAAEIQKSVKILIAEGQALGLTAAQNAQILQRAADVAAVTGNSLNDTSLAFAKALAGSSTSLQAFGIFTDQAALAHSKYGHELDKGIDTLNRHEKALLVMNSVFEQTVPLVGFASDQLNTAAGANQQYTQSLDTLQAKLGATNNIFVKFTQLQTQLIQTLTNLPSIFHTIVSSLVNVGGIGLQVIGTLITFSITIVSLKGMITGLNFALSRWSFATDTLNVLLGIAAKNLNMTIAPVTNLRQLLSTLAILIQTSLVASLKNFAAAMLLNIQRAIAFTATLLTTEAGLVSIATKINLTTAAILKLNMRLAAGALAMRRRLVAALIEGAAALKAFTISTFFTIAGLKGLVVGFTAVTASVYRFTVALLTNPLFVKAALIAATVYLVVKAFQQLKKELSFLGDEVSRTGKSGKEVSSVFKDLGDSLKVGFGFLVDVTKLIVIGLITIVKLAQAAYKGFMLLKAIATGNTDEVKRLGKEAQNLRDDFAELGQASLATQRKIGDALDGTAYAAIRAGKEIDNVKESMEGLAKAAAEITIGQELAINTEIFGDEIDKANLKLREAKELLEELNINGVIKIGTEILLPTSANLDKLQKGLLNKGDEKANFAPAGSEQLSAALLEVTRAQAEIDKKRIDLQTELTAIIKQQQVEALKGAQNEIESIQREGKIRLAEFQKRAAMFAKIETLSNKERILIGQVEKGIKAVTAAKIADARAAQADKFAEALEKANQKRQDQFKKEARVLKDLRRELSALSTDNITSSGDQLAIAELTLQARMLELSALEANLKKNKAFVDSSGKLKDNVVATLEAARELAKQKFDEMKPFTVGDLVSTVKTAFAAVKSIGSDLFSADGIAKAFKAGSTFLKEAFSADGIAEAFKAGSTFLKEAFKSGWESVKNIDLNKLGSSIASGASAALSGVMKFFDPKFISGLADSLKDLEKLPQALIDAFMSFIENLDSFIANFDEAVNNLIDKLPMIFQKILDALPELITKMLDGLMRVIDMLPQLFAQLMEALPGILQSILDKLPDIIEKILGALGNIIGQLIRAIPGIIVQLFEALPDIIESIIMGIMDALDQIVLALIEFIIKGLPKIIAALIRLIPRVIKAIVVGIIKGLQRGISRLFNGETIKPPKALTELPQKFAEGINNLAKKATEEAGKLFKVLDLQAATRGVDQADKMRDIFDFGVNQMVINFKGLFQWFGELWHKFLDALTAVWKWVWEKVLQPVIEGLTKVWTWVYEKIFEPIIEAIMKVWTWVSDNVIEPMVSALGKVFGWLLDNVIQPIINVVGPIFSAFGDALKWFVDFIKPVFEVFAAAIKNFGDFIKPVFEAFTSTLKPLVDGLKAAWEAIQDLFKGKDIGKIFSELGTKIWDSLKTAVNSGLDVFSNLGQKIYDKFKDLFGGKTISGIFSDMGTKIWDSLKAGLKNAGTVLKDVLDKLNPVNLLKKIFSIPDSAYGAKGPIEKLITIDVPFVK